MDLTSNEAVPECYNKPDGNINEENQDNTDFNKKCKKKKKKMDGVF